MSTLTPLTIHRSQVQPLDLASLPAEPVDGLYVHVPFCFHKCHYCDFYSITHQTEDRMDRFVDRLLTEAKFWVDRYPITVAPRTIFFGGGTPTLLPLPQMARLLSGLSRVFDLTGIDEWTVEANPATVTNDYCHMMRDHGVNRLSFGAQSFNPAELATLERHHDPTDVERSVAIATAAGFKRLNVDLIYAVPGQSLASWATSLDAAIALGTSHISAYALTYEPNTPMAVKKRLGTIVAAEESLEIDMMRHARSRLTQAGLAAYEISNYAAHGQECRHNLMYWTGGNYVSLGPSASAHTGGVRWKNRPHLGEWESAIDAGHLPATDVERLSPETRAGELAMLMLRLSGGINFDVYTTRTGRDARRQFHDIVARFAPVGLLEQTDNTIRLTPAGLSVADALASEFLQASNTV
ncbi:MAG TPA: radical SAM family heme chaperone HemW [Tepidisphaeraceae bacterium]|jgi:oxygen-independent coproporphyrinogen-3 oxidase|nr:radical SAM family heme chaperone HemW [Tepidisphaeraceae bacterium]